MAGTLAKIGNFIASVGKAIVNNPIFKAVTRIGTAVFGPGLALAGAITLGFAWLGVKAGAIAHTKVFKRFGGVDKSVETGWADALSGVEGSFMPMIKGCLYGYVYATDYLTRSLAESQEKWGRGNSNDIQGPDQGNREALAPEAMHLDFSARDVEVIDHNSFLPRSSLSKPLASELLRPKTHGPQIGG